MAKAKQIRIRCNAPASIGIKLVLMTRFEELLSWREVALDWTDPEGVHSMRVASRRLRSALRDFTPYVRKRRLAPVLKRLKNLADALGEVRDHDVAVLGLEEMQKQAPKHSSAALKELIEARMAVREQARQELAAIIAPETAGLALVAAWNAIALVGVPKRGWSWPTERRKRPSCAIA